MIPRRESPTLQRENFQSKSEAKEYVQLFLKDLCFWEQSDTLSQPPSSIFVVEQDQPREKAKPPRLLLERQCSDDSCQSSSNSAILKESDLRWRPAMDPVTGRTYYYETVTRVTQWEKPPELRAFERQQRREKKKQDRAFFREMEQNILDSLQRGERIPGEANADILFSDAKLPKEAKQQHAVRTISSMDERVLASLNQNEGKVPAENSRTGKGPATKPRRSSENQHPSHHGNRTPGRPPLPQRFFVPDDPSESTSSSYASSPSNSPGRLDSPPARAADAGMMANSHMRRNTGGTIFVKSTMANPDVEATVKCVCGVYRAHVLQGYKTHMHQPLGLPVSPNSVHVNLNMFRDDYEVVGRVKTVFSMPSIEEIYTFYMEFFRRSQMEHDTIIMSLIYAERLMKETNGRLAPNPSNWRSFLFSCMILASKVWDDLSMWNVDFSNVSLASGIAPFGLSRINDLEIGVLTSLGFDVRVAASEYAKYYFLIRTMLIRSGLLDNAAASLSKEAAKVFENRTSQYQNTRLCHKQQQQADPNSPPRNVSGRRSRSADWDWFVQHYGGGSSTSSGGTGPVLKENICLEQLVSLGPHHSYQ